MRLGDVESAIELVDAIGRTRFEAGEGNILIHEGDSRLRFYFLFLRIDGEYPEIRKLYLKLKTHPKRCPPVKSSNLSAAEYHKNPRS